MCKKNPRHLAYIPVGDFSHKDLPEPYRDSQFDDLVSYLSKLVVRINVYDISAKRPEKFSVKPNKKKSPKTPLITGSGKVIFSQMTPDNYFHFHREPTLIRIVTACHVVFDQLEGKSTTCDLFYDKEDSNFVTLKGYNVEYSKVDEDKTVFVCSTDDWSLIDYLRDTIYKYKDVYESLHEKYKEMENNNLVICVSHPHGYEKQISFGRYSKREILGSGPCKGSILTKYHYDVPTCASSSGAPLCIISKQGSWTHHPHTGAEGKTGFSGTEWEKSNKPF